MSEPNGNNGLDISSLRSGVGTFVPARLQAVPYASTQKSTSPEQETPSNHDKNVGVSPTVGGEIKIPKEVYEVEDPDVGNFTIEISGDGVLTEEQKLELAKSAKKELLKDRRLKARVEKLSADNLDLEEKASNMEKEAENKRLENERRRLELETQEIINVDKLNNANEEQLKKLFSLPLYIDTGISYDEESKKFTRDEYYGKREPLPNTGNKMTLDQFLTIKDTLSDYKDFIEKEDSIDLDGKTHKMTKRYERYANLVDIKRDLLLALRSGHFNSAQELRKKIENIINQYTKKDATGKSSIEREIDAFRSERVLENKKWEVAKEISDDYLVKGFWFSSKKGFVKEGKKVTNPPTKTDWDKLINLIKKLSHGNGGGNFFRHYQDAYNNGHTVLEIKRDLKRAINDLNFENFGNLVQKLEEEIRRIEIDREENKKKEVKAREEVKLFNKELIRRRTEGLIAIDKHTLDSPFIKIDTSYRNEQPKKIDPDSGDWVKMSMEELRSLDLANTVINDFRTRLSASVPSFKNQEEKDLWLKVDERLTLLKNNVLSCLNNYKFEDIPEIVKQYNNLTRLVSIVTRSIEPGHPKGIGRKPTDEDREELARILDENNVIPINTISQLGTPSTPLTVTPTVVSSAPSPASTPQSPEILYPLDFVFEIREINDGKGKPKRTVIKVNGKTFDIDKDDKRLWEREKDYIDPIKKKHLEFFGKGKREEQKKKADEFRNVIEQKNKVLSELEKKDLDLAHIYTDDWSELIDKAIEKWNKDTKKIEGEKEQKKEIEDKIKSFEKKRSEVVSIVNGSLRGKVDAVTQDELKALEGEFKNLEAVARGNIERGEKFESRTLTSIDEITEKYSVIIKKLNEEENKVYKNSWADILRARGVGAIRGGRPNTRVKVDYDKKITEEEDDTVDKSKAGRTHREIANESYQELLEKTSSFNNEEAIRASGAYNELLSRHQGMYSKDERKYEDLFAKKKFAASDFVEAQVVKDILGEKYTGEVNQAPTLPKVQSSFGKYDQTYKVPKPSFFSNGTPTHKTTENKVGKDTEKVWDNEVMKKDVEYKREILKEDEKVLEERILEQRNKNKAIDTTVNNLNNRQPAPKKGIANKFGLMAGGFTLVAGGLGLPAYMLTKDSPEPLAPVTANTEAKSTEVNPPVVERLEMSVEDIEFGDSWNEKEKIALKDIFSSAGSINQYIDKRIMTNDNGIYYKSQKISGNPFTYQILERNAWDILNDIDKYSWVDRYGNNTKESVQNCLDEILSLMKKLDPNFELADNKNMSMSDLIKLAAQKVDDELYKYAKEQPNAIK